MWAYQQARKKHSSMGTASSFLLESQHWNSLSGGLWLVSWYSLFSLSYFYHSNRKETNMGRKRWKHLSETDSHFQPTIRQETELFFSFLQCFMWVWGLVAFPFPLWYFCCAYSANVWSVMLVRFYRCSFGITKRHSITANSLTL